MHFSKNWTVSKTYSGWMQLVILSPKRCRRQAAFQRAIAENKCERTAEAPFASS